jgi:hypothetical protein
MPRRSQRRPNSRSRGSLGSPQPWILTLDAVAVTALNTVVNNTLYSNTSTTPQLITFRPISMSVNGGAAAADLWFVVRRVPQGYAAPSVSTGTSITQFIDTPNVLGYAFCKTVANTSTQNPFEFNITWLKRSMKCNEGDVVIMQAVSDTASAAQSYNAIGAYTLRT